MPQAMEAATIIEAKHNIMKLAPYVFLIMLSGCSPAPPDNSEIQFWFEKNYESLAKLALLGSEYPALRRAEPALKKYPNYYGEPMEADLIAEVEVFDIVQKLEIDYVAYWRAGSDDSRALHSMTVPYYRWGLALGGYSKGIIFFPDYLSKEKPPTEHKTYTHLSKQGWFIVESDTR